MATLTGLTIVKEFDYRDILQEEWSNQYWFKGAPPGDDPSWLVVMNDVLAFEKPVVHLDTTFVRAYGYDSDDSTAHHVFAHDWVVPGPPPTGQRVPVGGPFAGDQAACVSWKTDKLNSRGKPIYLRKYLHGGDISPTDRDALEPTYLQALNTYAASIRTYHGGLTNPSSATTTGGTESAVAVHVVPWVTTRTLRRRGPRPKTGA